MTAPVTYDLLPPLSSEEYAALEADIKARGVLVPVFVDEAGNVLDGRHRLKIDPSAPRTVINGLSSAEKEAFVFRCNFVRRNLSPEQKDDARKRMKATAKHLREENQQKWTQQAVAEALGIDQTTVSKWFQNGSISNMNGHKANKPDARLKLTPEHKEEIAERIESGETQAQVAADLGVSQGRVSQIVKREKKQRQKQEQLAEWKDGAEPPSTLASVVLADPPWRYEFSPTESREIENQYPTATLDEIISHRPETADDAVLYLWATAPKLLEALRVMEEWGFVYVTNAVWDKEIIGMGYWFRGQHELLLVGKKGSMSPPDSGQRVSSVFRERRSAHSAKPNCVYRFIEAAFPDQVRLEMYQRTARKGWIGYGNESG